MSKTIPFLALGDSYTIGECVDEKERWPTLLAELLIEKGIQLGEPHIIATTGWRTDELKGAIEKEQPSNDFGLVSLSIGVNNQYQNKSVESYKPEFEELLNIALDKAGGNNERVMVLSIPDYGFTPIGEGKQSTISHELELYNKANKAVAKKYGVWYFDITPSSTKGLEDPTLVTSDNLHPSGKLYKIWVDIILSNHSFVNQFKNK